MGIKVDGGQIQKTQGGEDPAELKTTGGKTIGQLRAQFKSSLAGEPLVKQSEVSKDQWENLKAVAALDGDASSISRLDLDIAANPRLAATKSADGKPLPPGPRDSNTLDARDLITHNLHNGKPTIDPVVKKGPDAAAVMKALVEVLQGKEGITIGGSVAVPKIMLSENDTLSAVNTLSGEQIETARTQFAPTQSAIIFNGGQSEVVRQLITHPDRVTTMTVSTDNPAQMKDAFAIG